MNDNTLKLIFSRLQAKIGITRLHGHLLRHTFTSRYLMNRGDILSLKRMLGDASIQMVAKYTHLAEREEKKRQASSISLSQFFVSTSMKSLR